MTMNWQASGLIINFNFLGDQMINVKITASYWQKFMKKFQLCDRSISNL